jgi:hypothetical protein
MYQIYELTKPHPADELFAWLVVQIAKMSPRKPEKTSFLVIKERLYELYNKGYKRRNGS